jgi:hypothetical protein
MTNGDLGLKDWLLFPAESMENQNKQTDKQKVIK